MAHRIACILVIGQRQANFHSFAEACYRFSPQLAVRSLGAGESSGAEGEAESLRRLYEAVFVEIGACRKLYSEQSFVKRAQVLARRFGCSVRVAIADQAGIALAMARYGAVDWKQLPLRALIDFATPFYFNEDLHKRIEGWIEVLRALGLETIEDFSKLPSSSLSSRFGKEAMALGACVRGELRQAWPGFHPKPQVIEAMEVSDVQDQAPCSMQEFLIFAIKQLGERAMARLRGRGERASAVEIELQLENWSVLKYRQKKWQINLPLPQGSTAGLLPILREHLAFQLDREPLPAPVKTVRLRIVETVPGLGAQRDFFRKGEAELCSATRSKEEEQEAWDALVGRLSYKLGKSRVFLAQPVERYLPERAWTKTLEPVAEFDYSKEEPPPSVEAELRAPVERPARVFRQPEPVEIKGNQLFHPVSGKRWQVLKWEGPERLSGEWWVASGLGPEARSKDAERKGFDRDYFQVFTETGELLWVFLNRKTATPSSAEPGDPAPGSAQPSGPAPGSAQPSGPMLYLHGYFD